ncbi:hypothetical protein HHI36_019701, partial [Cryptolaemus montrouzieri]
MGGILITGYEVASCFVRKGTEHGRCLILIREDILYYPLENVMNLSIEGHIEMAAIYAEKLST